MAGALEAWITWATWVALEAGWQVIQCKNSQVWSFLVTLEKVNILVSLFVPFKIVVLLIDIEKRFTNDFDQV